MNFNRACPLAKLLQALRSTPFVPAAAVCGIVLLMHYWLAGEALHEWIGIVGSCCRAPYPSLFLVVSHASFRECHTADADGQRDCDWAFAEHLDHLHLRSAHEPRGAAFPASIRHAKHLSAHPPLIVALDAPLRSAPLRIPRQETHEHALAKTL